MWTQVALSAAVTQPPSLAQPSGLARLGWKGEGSAEVGLPRPKAQPGRRRDRPAAKAPGPKRRDRPASPSGGAGRERPRAANAAAAPLPERGRQRGRLPAPSERPPRCAWPPRPDAPRVPGDPGASRRETRPGAASDRAGQSCPVARLAVGWASAGGDGQAQAALGAAAVDHGAAVLGGHAGAKAVGADATGIAGIAKAFFHDGFLEGMRPAPRVGTGSQGPADINSIELFMAAKGPGRRGRYSNASF